jgi:hypothetical protein
MGEIDWDIRRKGYGWEGDHAMDRFLLAPEKFEMTGGKLFWTKRSASRPWVYFSKTWVSIKQCDLEIQTSGKPPLLTFKTIGSLAAG